MGKIKEFEMSEDQFNTLMETCKPIPLAWKALGKEMGFDFMTANPVKEKTLRFFTAEVVNSTQ